MINVEFCIRLTEIPQPNVGLDCYDLTMKSKMPFIPAPNTEIGFGEDGYLFNVDYINYYEGSDTVYITFKDVQIYNINEYMKENKKSYKKEGWTVKNC